VLGTERGNCTFLGLKLKTGLTLLRGADPTVPQPRRAARWARTDLGVDADVRVGGCHCPHPGDHPDGRDRRRPPPLYKPNHHGQRPPRTGAGRLEKIEIYFRYRPWSRWTEGEQRLGEIMQQQAETVGKGARRGSN
jgi:hypothetical protein